MDSFWPTWPLDASTKWPAICSCILVVAFTTRVLSGRSNKPKVTDDGVKTVPTVPYWFPILGHIPSLAVNGTNFMNWARQTYRDGSFALNLGGTTHNFVFHPALCTALLNQKNPAADCSGVFKHIMCATFGFPRAEMGKYDAALDEITACYKHLMSDPSLGIMVDKTVGALKYNIANFVSFAPSLVDQTQWERSSDVKVVEANGEPVVEANLLTLVRDFVAFTANPALVGTDFTNNYPDFFSDLWDMDRGFIYLSTGLPRWTPFPPITRAHAARNRMHTALRGLEEALDKDSKGQDPGTEWHALDDVSSLVKARAEVYRKYDFSIKGRAAFETALLWAMNANANPLVFWMIVRIYADSSLLARLREEVAPYVRVVEPPRDFGIPEPLRLESVDHEGLINKCPLLKSCYIESLRLDTAIYGFRVMKEDLILSGRDKTADKLMLKKGTYAHVANDIHHKDPQYFDDAETWRADRHVRYDEGDDGEKTVKVDMGTVKPFGGGHNMCKGRAFAQKEVALFTAAIISFWEIGPVGGGPWKMPKQTKATGTCTTKDSTKVWIRRRVVS